jgi:hypothetical protein
VTRDAVMVESDSVEVRVSLAAEDDLRRWSRRGGALRPAITRKEIAELERLSPDAIYRAIASGDLPARKGLWPAGVDRADYEAWKQRHRVRPRQAGPMFVPRQRVRTAPAAVRIREGASIPELAEELGHSPQMKLGSYTQVINELRGRRGCLPSNRSRRRAPELSTGSSGLCERP